LRKYIEKAVRRYLLLVNIAIWNINVAIWYF